MNYPGWGDGLRISVGTDDANRRLPGAAEDDGLKQAIDATTDAASDRDSTVAIMPRTANIQRKTAETEIELELESRRHRASRRSPPASASSTTC